MTVVPVDWPDGQKTYIDQETLDRLYDVYGGPDGLATVVSSAFDAFTEFVNQKMRDVDSSIFYE